MLHGNVFMFCALFNIVLLLSYSVMTSKLK